MKRFFRVTFKHSIFNLIASMNNPYFRDKLTRLLVYVLHIQSNLPNSPDPEHVEIQHFVRLRSSTPLFTEYLYQ